MALPCVSFLGRSNGTTARSPVSLAASPWGMERTPVTEGKRGLDSCRIDLQNDESHEIQPFAGVLH
jgi:hypothetical protein